MLDFASLISRSPRHAAPVRTKRMRECARLARSEPRSSSFAWIVAGNMAPRQDPCQESSSVRQKRTAVEGELHRHCRHFTWPRREVNALLVEGCVRDTVAYADGTAGRRAQVGRGIQPGGRGDACLDV